jgi:hypothetical protein
MHSDDTILAKLAEAETPELGVELFFYHGTIERFDQAPETGAYDGVFWLADNPAVAQTYIPAAGLECLMGMGAWRLGERVWPNLHSDWYAMVVRMGFGSPDVDWGPDGSATSWAVPAGYPTYGDVCDWIERELGYQNDSRQPQCERSYRVKAAIRDGKTIYLPANHLSPGRLFLVDGLRDLRFLDLAAGREGDLNDPDYHKIAAFRRAEAAGYDGVIINDFAQSRTHGNVGHLSWGVFPRTLPRLAYASLEATRFDWAEDDTCCGKLTPEFVEAWGAGHDQVPGARY